MSIQKLVLWNAGNIKLLNIFYKPHGINNIGKIFMPSPYKNLKFEIQQVSKLVKYIEVKVLQIIVLFGKLPFKK